MLLDHPRRGPTLVVTLPKITSLMSEVPTTEPATVDHINLPTTAKKAGRKSWATGTKKVFLNSRAAEYLAASQSNTAGRFFDDITKRWLYKYGYVLPDNVDIAVDIPDPTDADLEVEIGGELPTEQERAKKFLALRTVSNINAVETIQ